MNQIARRATAAMLPFLLVFGAFATSAAASSPEDWAKAYCKAGPKVTDALNASAEIERELVDVIRANTDATEVIDRYDTQLAKVAKLAKKAAKALKKAGAPDVKNGAKLNSAGIKAYKTVSTEIATARAALADIDPTNPAASGDPLLALGGALGDAASALNDFSFDALSPALEKSKDLTLAVSDAC